MNWDEAVEDIGPRLYKYFCVRFDDIQADDMTQETLIRLVRKVNEGKFDPQRGSLRMLGFGIAHYVALEAMPRSQMESISDISERELPDTEKDSPETLLITKDQASKVRKSFKYLSPIEQQIIALSVDEELSLKDISIILQIPIGTIKSHIFRAKRKLVTLVTKEVCP